MLEHEEPCAIDPLTGGSVSKRSLEEILPDAALDFDAFYQQRSVATAAGSILVAAVDGKGIPMVKPCGAQPAARLTKGQKANKKRMVTRKRSLGLRFLFSLRALRLCETIF